MKNSFQFRKIAQLTGHEAAIFALGGDRQAPLFFSGGGEGWLVEWDLREPEMGKLRAKIEDRVFSLCKIAGEQRLVVGGMNGGVYWIDLQNTSATKSFPHHRKGVFKLCQIGDHVYSTGGDGMLTKWSIEESRPMESIRLSAQPLRGIDYSAVREELAIGSSDHGIYILDINSWRLKREILPAHDNSVFAVHYTRDGRHLISGGRDAQLAIWDIEHDWQLDQRIDAHWFTINSIAFHPKESIFASASRDKTIKIWDASNFKLIKVLEAARDGGHYNSVNVLFWSQFNNYLISAGDDRSIIIWRMKDTTTKP